MNEILFLKIFILKFIFNENMRNTKNLNEFLIKVQYMRSKMTQSYSVMNSYNKIKLIIMIIKNIKYAFMYKSNLC